MSQGWAMRAFGLLECAPFFNLFLTHIEMLLGGWASSGKSLLKLIHHLSLLSSEGCSLLLPFNSLELCLSLSTSCIGSSFSLEMRLSQFSTNICCTIKLQILNFWANVIVKTFNLNVFWFSTHHTISFLRESLRLLRRSLYVIQKIKDKINCK